MKKIILLGLTIFSIVNCQTKPDDNKTRSESPKTNRNKMNNAIIYGIDYDINNHFQILVNDDFVAQNLNDGNSSAFLPINELLIANKKPILKVKLYKSSKEKFITEDLYKYFSLKIVASNNSSLENFTTVQTIEIPKQIKNKEFVEFTFDLNVDMQKLNPIIGWSKSENLIKNDDNDLLKKEVDAFYLKFFNILNSGNYNDYHAITQKRDDEVLLAYFNSPEILEEQKDEKEKLLAARGKMKKLNFSNYNLKFYGDGKLVTLEDENGESPLYYENEVAIRVFGIVLHRPKKGAPLEIIR